MKYKKYRTHYLNYKEQEVINRFDKGPTVTDEIEEILTRPHNDKTNERTVPPMRKKKTVTFD